MYGRLRFGSSAPLFGPALPSLPAPSFSPLGGAPSLRSGFLSTQYLDLFLGILIRSGAVSSKVLRGTGREA